MSSYRPFLNDQGMMEKEVPSRGYKVVVLNDIHFPNHDQKSIRAFYKFLGHKDTPKFDEVIINGDLMDYAYCSRWIKSKYRYLEGTRFKDDHDAANDWLDDFQDKCRQNNKDINFTILEGNHDKRPKDVIEANPQLAGLIEMQNSLNFEERGIFFMENWENNQLYKIGDAHFHHYPRKGGGGKHHAKGIVTRFRMNIIYAHLHDSQLFAVSQYGEGNSVYAQSNGCMCEYRQEYLGYSPTNWQQAFSTIDFHKSGNFNHYLYQIKDNAFTTPWGKRFSGRN